MDDTRAEEVKKLIEKSIRKEVKRFKGYRVFLFGSRALGTARPRSDFDIGILGSQPLPISDFYHLEDKLDELPTLYRIDLVDIYKTSPEFRAEALKQTTPLL